MKILYEKENPLLNRKRVALEIDHPNSSTPSRTKLKSDIAKHLKTDEKLILIRHVYSKFGENKSKVIVHVYNDEKELNRLEKIKREKAPKEEPKSEEKPTEQKSKENLSETKQESKGEDKGEENGEKTETKEQSSQ